MEDKPMPRTTTASSITSRRDEPSLAELFEALGPCRAVLSRMSTERTRRLAPVVLRAVATLMTEDEVVVVPHSSEGIGELGEELLALVAGLLTEADDLDGRLAVLNAASDLVGKLDSKTFKELQKTDL
jgi:hypothetical protein